MKKHLFLFLIIASLLGCVRNNARPIFDSIDLSYSNGWEYGFSLNIDSNNIVRKCDYKIINKIESIKCYCDTLSHESTDSLNYFISKLKDNKPDSLYTGNCQDCSWYLISVNFDSNNLKTEIVGNKHKNVIASLGQFILKRSYSMRNKVDTTYSFKYTANLIQTPPPDTLK